MPDSTNPKLEELRRRNALHPNPERVSAELFVRGTFFDARDAVQVKYEMLRLVRVDGVSVVRAALEHGYARPTFYEAKEAFEQDGIAGLLPHKRGPRSAHKLSQEVMDFLGDLLDDCPSLNSRDLADRVLEEYGISVHPRSVERALARGKKRRQ